LAGEQLCTSAPLSLCFLLSRAGPAHLESAFHLVGLGGDLNDYLLSVLLGVIEGLTEFLPVSSTAHLRITESFLGIDLGNGYWKMFSIVIQLGAILCLPVYFAHRIDKLLGIRTGEHNFLMANFLRLWKTVVAVFQKGPVQLVAMAFVCTAIPA